MSNLERWDPEDESFWASTGKSVATRNLSARVQPN